MMIGFGYALNGIVSSSCAAYRKHQQIDRKVDWHSIDWPNAHPLRIQEILTLQVF